MSPREALQSPVALFYAGLAFGLLLLAGLLFSVLGKGGGAAWHAYRGWLVMVPVTAAAVFLGRVPAILFFTGVGLLGFREFARATGLCADRCLSGGVYLGILAAGGRRLHHGLPPLSRSIGIRLVAALRRIWILVIALRRGLAAERIIPA